MILWIIGVLWFLCFVLIIIGLISPKVALFWYSGTRTRLLSTLLYSLLCILLFVAWAVTAYTLAEKDYYDDDEKVEVENPLKKLTDSLNRQASSDSYNSRIDAAMEGYNKVITMNLDTSDHELKDNLAEAYRGRGGLYDKRKKYDLAIQDYTKALTLDNNWGVYEDRAASYVNLEQYDMALKDWNTIIAADSTDADDFRERGYVYSKMENYKLALKDFEKALQLDKDDINAMTNIGIMKSNLKDHKGAIEIYNRILKLDSENAEIYWRLSFNKDAIDDYDGAMADINKAIAIDPKQGSYYHDRGDLKLDADYNSGACADFAKARSLGTDVSMHVKDCK